MARKKKHAAHENHERWMVSYADFVTLLFAFFVVMFASSQTDKGKAQAVSESVTKALQEGAVSAAVAGLLGGTQGQIGPGNAMRKGPGGVNTKPAAEAKAMVLAELLPSMQSLNQELKKEIAAGKLELRLEQRGLVVSLKEAAFFASGDDTIAPGGIATIGTISEAIKKLPNPVRLEGYTDSVPIHNPRFRSNWELSVARAISMLNLLSAKFGVPSSQLNVAGYADNHPIATNDNDAGRAQNRRVDIVILNQAGYEMEPNSGVKVTEPAKQAAAAPAHAKKH